MKIGIPRAMTYYYFNNLWISFFKYLNVDIVISPLTNKKILKKGSSLLNDETCLSFKIYMGHIDYLINKVDYVLVPRIDNYGYKNQTCTNFLSFYDISSNIFKDKIITYNIDYESKETERKSLIDLGIRLGFGKKEVKRAYINSKLKEISLRKIMVLENISKLNSSNKKILIVSHPYNTYDNLIGKRIIEMIDKDIDIIYSDLFDSKKVLKKAKELSHSLYWKYNKEIIGSIKLCEDKIDGIIFLSSFPCGPDSIVNELVMRKINLPYLNLVIDDLDSFSGIETRIESFIDILGDKND